MSALLTDAKQRLVDIGIEYLSQLVPSIIAGGAPRFWHFEEAFPYFTCRTGLDTVEFDSEDFDRDIYTLTLRLVVGHLTSGYEGQHEEDLDTWIPGLKTYINERELLQCSAHDDALDGLIRARCISVSGFNAFPNSGLAVVQVGTDYTVACEFDETINQAYL